MNRKFIINYRNREMLFLASYENLYPQKCAAIQFLKQTSVKLDQPGKKTPVR